MYYHNHTICYYDNTGWCRNVGCLIILGHFMQKSPKLSDSFAERDLQLKASYAFPPLCKTMCYYHDHTIFKPMIPGFSCYATIWWCNASYAPICSFNAACCSCVMVVLNVAIWCCDMPASLHAFSNICVCEKERKRENDRKKREGACDYLS